MRVLEAKAQVLYRVQAPPMNHRTQQRHIAVPPGRPPNIPELIIHPGIADVVILAILILLARIVGLV